MTDAAAKSSVQAGTAPAERKPQIAANEQQSIAVQAMHALHAQGGNRAVTQTLGGGRPLTPDVQAEMEAYFGVGFGDVRIHDDARSHEHATTLQANAYTTGNHIVFNAQRFAPASMDGKRLLAHELAHVVQQRNGGSLQPRSDGAGPLEVEAHAASDAVAQGQSAQISQGSAMGIAASPFDDAWKKVQRVADDPGKAFDSAIETVKDAPGKLYDKAGQAVDAAGQRIQNAAYNFDADAANKLSDVMTPAPGLIADGLDYVAEKTQGTRFEGTAQQVRNTVKPVAEGIRDGNRDVIRETLVGQGFQAGADKAINRVDAAVQGLLQRYEQEDYSSEQAPTTAKTDTPLADAADKYLADPSRLLREAQVGTAQAVWKIVPGVGRMIVHPVATVRSLENMPVVADPLGLARGLGATTGFLWDTTTGAKTVSEAADEMNEKLDRSPSKELDKTIGLVKGLSHDWVKAYEEGRPVAATTHAITDVAMLVLPFLQVGKAGATVDAMNAVSRTGEGVNATSKLGTTSDALKVLDEASSATKGSSVADNLIDTAATATKESKSVGSPLRGVPAEFFDEAIAKLDELADPFTSGYGKKTLDKLRKGETVAGDAPLRPHIDEPLAVGADVKPQRQFGRATDPHNRQFLDPKTNGPGKGVATSADDIARNRNPLEPVSLADEGIDPSVVFTRRFGEVSELRQVFDEAMSSIGDMGKYKPTRLKARINKNMIDIIRDGRSPAGAAVRDALGKLGYEYLPGKGLSAVKPPAGAAAADATASGVPRVRIGDTPPAVSQMEAAADATASGAQRVRIGDTPPAPSQMEAAADATASGESRVRIADDSAAELEALQDAESIPEKVLKKMRLGD